MKHRPDPSAPAYVCLPVEGWGMLLVEWGAAVGVSDDTWFKQDVQRRFKALVMPEIDGAPHTGQEHACPVCRCEVPEEIQVSIISHNVSMMALEIKHLREKIGHLKRKLDKRDRPG